MQNVIIFILNSLNAKSQLDGLARKDQKASYFR